MYYKKRDYKYILLLENVVNEIKRLTSNEDITDDKTSLVSSTSYEIDKLSYQTMQIYNIITSKSFTSFSNKLREKLGIPIKLSGTDLFLEIEKSIKYYECYDLFPRKKGKKDDKITGEKIDNIINMILAEECENQESIKKFKLQHAMTYEESASYIIRIFEGYFRGIDWYTPRLFSVTVNNSLSEINFLSRDHLAEIFQRFASVIYINLKEFVTHRRKSSLYYNGPQKLDQKRRVSKRQKSDIKKLGSERRVRINECKTSSA